MILLTPIKKASRTLPRPFLLSYLLLFLLLGNQALWAGDPVPGDDIRRTAIVQAVEQAGPAVVNINTQQAAQDYPFGFFGNSYSADPFFRRFFEPNIRQAPRTSLGSGVLIDSAGYILTNEHVIRGGSKITVTLKDGREFVAEPIGAVAAMDLAILKIDTGQLLVNIKTGTSEDLILPYS